VNTAVNWCAPTANVDVVPDAAPLLTITGFPRLAIPSLNCTVPVAVVGVTVANSDTGVPRRTGEAGYVISAAPVGVAPVGAAIAKVNGGDVDGLNAVGLAGMNTAANS
jgi:hypothetical protein